MRRKNINDKKINNIILTFEKQRNKTLPIIKINLLLKYKLFKTIIEIK